jgi:hypothetical protein
MICRFGIGSFLGKAERVPKLKTADGVVVCPLLKLILPSSDIASSARARHREGGAPGSFGKSCGTQGIFARFSHPRMPPRGLSHAEPHLFDHLVGAVRSDSFGQPRFPKPLNQQRCV